MSVETYKRAAAARALDFVRPGMRLGLGTGSTAKHFVDLLGERVRGGTRCGRGADVGGDAHAGRAPRHPADHARRHPRARPDRRRRRRDRAGPDLDQRRRRRAVAREDRGLGIGDDGRDRRRLEMGRDAWPLSACRSKSCRSAQRRPAAPSKRPPPRQPATGRRYCARPRAAILSSRMAGTGCSTPNCGASPTRGLSRRSFPQSRASWNTACSSASRGIAIVAGPDGVRLVERS